ncbi:hypothetical protein ACLKA6_013009 [Drosophila palustris]
MTTRRSLANCGNNWLPWRKVAHLYASLALSATQKTNIQDSLLKSIPNDVNSSVISLLLLLPLPLPSPTLTCGSWGKLQHAAVARLPSAGRKLQVEVE